MTAMITFNYDAYMMLSVCELWWRINNIEQNSKYNNTIEPDLTIYADASFTESGVTGNTNPCGGGGWGLHSKEMTY